MFNLGGEDKEKLKENMEEIKDLVNSQHNQENAGNNTDSQPSPPQERPEPDIPEELDTNSVNNSDNNQDINESEAGGPREAPEPDMSQETDTDINTQDFETKDQKEDFQDSNERFSSRNGDLKNNLESITNEVKKLDKSRSPNSNKNASNTASQPSRPSGNGETVFLEVDEFQDVKGKVEEMRYLSREIKDLVSNLEEGVNEDRRIESEAQDVLNDFTARRESIQNSMR